MYVPELNVRLDCARETVGEVRIFKFWLATWLTLCRLIVSTIIHLSVANLGAW
jgi:hypothetical protein